MTLTVVPFAITTVFAGIFIYSAAHEFMKRRREGPLKNQRDAFDFDTSAPSYQDPEPSDGEEARPGTDAQQDETQASETQSEKHQ